MNLADVERASVGLAKKDLTKALRMIDRDAGTIKPFLKAGLRSRAFDAAGDSLSALAEIRPFLKAENSPWQVRYLYARYLTKLGRPKEAIDIARLAYAESDADHEALMVLLHVLLDSAEYEEALTLIEDRMDSDETPKAVLLAGASCYRASGELEKAIAVADRLLERYPSDPTVLRLKADSVAEADSLAGIKIYDLAVKASIANGQNANASKWNMSLHLLRTRDFKRGWEYWELGSTKEVGTMGRVLPHFVQALPRANLARIDPEKWTIVVAEQGVGDQVLFLSALKDLLADSPKTIVVSDARMTSMVQRSFPTTLVVKPGFLDLVRDLKGLELNGYLPMGSILPHYRPQPEDFLKHRTVRFLVPDHKEVSRFRKLLLEKANGRPIIGVSWKGGFWKGQKRNKSMSLLDWTPIFNSKALIVNLQYGDVKDDIETLTPEQRKKFVTFPKIDFKKDLDSWLAITCACDGIVSISTALVHFASAAGVTTKIVMPVTQGPWILGMNDKGHLAYSAAHIYRRQGRESFNDLLNRVATMIE